MYHTIQAVNNKGADQTAQMRRLTAALLFTYGKSRFSHDMANMNYIFLTFIMFTLHDYLPNCFTTLMYVKKNVIIPPANFVCGGVYCFHVRLCVHPSVTPFFSYYLENPVMDIHQFLQTH